MQPDKGSGDDRAIEDELADHDDHAAGQEVKILPHQRIAPCAARGKEAPPGGKHPAIRRRLLLLARQPVEERPGEQEQADSHDRIRQDLEPQRRTAEPGRQDFLDAFDGRTLPDQREKGLDIGLHRPVLHQPAFYDQQVQERVAAGRRCIEHRQRSGDQAARLRRIRRQKGAEDRKAADEDEIGEERNIRRNDLRHRDAAQRDRQERERELNQQQQSDADPSRRGLAQQDRQRSQPGHAQEAERRFFLLFRNGGCKIAQSGKRDEGEVDVHNGREELQAGRAGHAPARASQHKVEKDDSGYGGPRQVRRVSARFEPPREPEER